MSVITRAQHPSLLWPGVMSIFGNSYNEFPAEWSQIFEKRTGTKAWEDLVSVSGFGLAPIKTEAAPIQYDTDAENYKTRLVQTVYGLGYQVTREEIEDSQYEQVSRRRARALAKSMRTTAEIVHANVLNRAFTTGYNGGDGVSLVNTAHPTKGAVYSNRMAADEDLSFTAIENMINLMAVAKDDRGYPIRLRAMKLVVPAGAAEFTARRIFQSDLQPGGNNNDINTLRNTGIQVVASHYLTDPDSWFLITDADEGLISIWRREAEIQRDNDFDTENARAKSTMRFVPGWGDPRAVYGSAGA